VTKYYNNITLPIGLFVRIQGDIQWWIVQNALTSYKRKTRGTSRGPGRLKPQTISRWSTLRCASLISNRENPQALRSGHKNLGESELPNEWCGKCQVACSDKHACIDKFESKEHVLKTMSWVHAYRNMKEASSNEMYISDKTSCTGLVNRFMRLIHRGDNPNKKALIYIPYTSCLHQLSTNNLSCPQ